MTRWSRWIECFIATLAAAFVSSAMAQAKFAEGTHYQRLKTPQTVESGAAIEVLEFFSYGCPHCRDLEEFLGPWIKKVPTDVSFKRVPALFQPPWINLAKAFYTLEALGREDLSAKVFYAIHTSGMKLHEEKVFLSWAEDNGLDVGKTREMWNSFTVSSKMNRAKTLAINYELDGVPTLFIDGKYKLQTTTEGQGPVAHKNAPAALDFLIAKARSERKK
jgi:protein dithiol oxidoreductase (disulfide-forming)